MRSSKTGSAPLNRPPKTSSRMPPTMRPSSTRPARGTRWEALLADQPSDSNAAGTKLSPPARMPSQCRPPVSAYEPSSTAAPRHSTASVPDARTAGTVESSSAAPPAAIRQARSKGLRRPIRAPVGRGSVRFHGLVRRRVLGGAVRTRRAVSTAPAIASALSGQPMPTCHYRQRRRADDGRDRHRDEQRAVVGGGPGRGSARLLGGGLVEAHVVSIQRLPIYTGHGSRPTLAGI
jgi:hypothetical protein